MESLKRPLIRDFFLSLVTLLIFNFSTGIAQASVTAPNFVFKSATLAGSVGGIATDSSGNIYVTIFNSTSIARVAKYNSSGSYITQTGTYGTGNNQFKYPSGIAVDASGNIYVADTNNHRIQKMNSSLAWQWTVGGTVSGSGNSQFKSPRGIEVDNTNGRLYVADTGNYRVQVFDLNGNYLDQFGTLGADPGEFGDPRGIAVDSSGNIYVVDGNRDRVQKFDINKNFIRQFGTTDYSSTEIGKFDYPRDVAIHPTTGDIYIADTNNFRVQRITSDGTFLKSFGSEGALDGQFTEVIGIAIDPNGNIITGEGSTKRFQKFDFSGTEYQISGLGSSVVEISNNFSVSDTSLVGVNNASANLRIGEDEGILAIADITVDMTSDRDWSSVSAGSSIVSGKAYVDGLTSAPGASPTHTLYIPMPEGYASSSVYICPNATNFNDISTSCSDGVKRTTGTYEESFGNIDVSIINNLGDGNTYWRIEGMTGSGGISDDLIEIEGSGTSEDPYGITNCLQLQEIRADLDAYYELVNDIDCSETSSWNDGAGFIPIGTLSSPFTGNLNGNDYSISDLFIVNSELNYRNEESNKSGLFGYASGASISDVNLTDFEISSQFNTGGLIGYMDGGSVDSCSASGILRYYDNVDVDPEQIGGLVGVAVNFAEISNSSTNVSMNFGDNVYNLGGFIGILEGDSLIENCSSIGTISIGLTSYQIGGFVGWLREESTINDSFSTVALELANLAGGIGSSIGGFAGFVGYGGDGQTDPGSGYINRSYSTGSIEFSGDEGVIEVGGFAGSFWYGGSIIDSYSTGSITMGIDTLRIGGFIGYVNVDDSEDVEISRCHSTGGVSLNGGDNIGGLIGAINLAGTAATANITIEDSYSRGNITGIGEIGDGEYISTVGGFVGHVANYNSNSDIYLSRDFSLSNITTIDEDDRAGGFLGETGGGAGTVVIDQCASYGDVDSFELVGGFAGGISSTDIPILVSNSFSRGNVLASNSYGDASAGGFVSDAKVVGLQNTYSTGTVEATLPTEYLGGYCGYYVDVTTTSSYWDTQSSGVDIDGQVTGYTTSQLKNAANLTGWDFDTIWAIDPNINDGYPSLGFSNPYLSNLNVSDGDLSPVFNSTTDEYSLTTSEDTISFRPIFEYGLGTTTINNIPTNHNEWSSNFDLEDGENEFVIVATSYDTRESFTYTVTVTKGEDDRVAILNLHSSLRAFDKNSSLDATKLSKVFKGNGRKISLRSSLSNKLIAETTVNLTQSRIWSNVNAGVDTTLKRSFVHLLATADGASDTFTLYVPKAIGDNRVRICPGASSLNDVTLFCGSGIILTEVSENVDIVLIGDESYWEITGLSGTGGISYAYEEPEEDEDDPITPPIDNEEDEDPTIPPVDDQEEEPVVPPVDEEDPITPSVDDQENLPSDDVEETTPVMKEFFSKIGNTVSKIYNSAVKSISDSNINTPTTQAVVATSVSATFVTYLFNAFAIGKDSSLYTLQLISSIFAFGKLRKKTQNYGIVYDSITKEPISQAVVRVTDTSGRLITTAVTDVYGVFDLTFEDGNYKFEVEANGYTFPSRVIQTSEDEPYRNIYRGNIITHSSSNALNISIPMDKVNSRFMEESAASAKNIWSTALNILVTVLFIIGFVTTVAALFNNPSTLAWIVFGIYILFVVVYLVLKVSDKKKFGYVRGTNASLLSGLEIGLIEQEFNQLYAKRVTDNEGKYRFIVPEGKYKLVLLHPELEFTNLDKDIFEVKKGSLFVLKKDLTVKKKIVN